MNWFKKISQEASALDSHLEYFNELSDYGDYTPKPEDIYDNLGDQSIVDFVGEGDSGQAYRLDDGSILKITTNNREGKISDWLRINPHPNIVRYDRVWQSGDLYYIKMENIDATLPPNIFHLISLMEKLLLQKKCTSPDCAIKIFSNMRVLKRTPFFNDIISYLNHIKKLNPYDFFNKNNIGIKDGKLKFFDIN